MRTPEASVASLPTTLAGVIEVLRNGADTGTVSISTIGPNGSSADHACRTLVEAIGTEYDLNVRLCSDFDSAMDEVLTGSAPFALIPSAYRDATGFHWHADLTFLGCFVQRTPAYGLATLDGAAGDGEVVLAAMSEVRDLFEQLAGDEIVGRLGRVLEASSTSHAARMVRDGVASMAVCNQLGLERNGLSWFAHRPGVPIVWMLFARRSDAAPALRSHRGDSELSFAWWDEMPFGLYGAQPVAPGLPANEQIQLGRVLLSQAPAGTRLVGALPFDMTEPGALWLGTPEPIPTTVSSTSSGKLTVATEVQDAEFAEFTKHALRTIEDGLLSKVVASRRVEVVSERRLRPVDVWRRLGGDDTAVAFYCATMTASAGTAQPPEPGPVLVGATPEILLRKEGDQILSLPVAGSRERRPLHSVSDAEEMLDAPKDLHEHELVVDSVIENLRAGGVIEVWREEPHVLGTRRMWHLASRVHGALADSGELDSLALVERLHPTPAVCGTPVDAAMDYLRTHESSSRGLYAGAVGWQDQDGNGEWRVTLRCGLIQGHTAHVQSGAGLVVGSEVDAELAETRSKARTLIDAL